MSASASPSPMPQEIPDELQFPTQLRQLLNAREWTVAALARETGISPRSIRDYLKGAHTPDVDYLERLITALDVSGAWAAAWRTECQVQRQAQQHARGAAQRAVNQARRSESGRHPGGFHDDLQAIMAERGWSARRLALEVGLHEARVEYWLRTGGYPSSENLETLIVGLNVPAETATRWRAELEAGRSDLHWVRPPPQAPRQQQTKLCLRESCYREFVPSEPSQDHCSRVCARAPKMQALDNALKRAFERERKSRRISQSRVALDIGIPQSTISHWLKTPGSRLTNPLVAKIADWLKIATDDAVEQQGGTHGERVGEALRGSEKFHRVMKRRWRSTAFRRKVKKALSATHKGRQVPQEQRDKSSAFHKARYAAQKAQLGPSDVHPSLAHVGTNRQRALATRAMIRRWHPELSPKEVDRLTVERIMETLKVGDERAARTLLRDKPKKGQARLGRKFDPKFHAEVFAELDRHPGYTPWDEKPHTFWRPVVRRVWPNEEPDAVLIARARRRWSEHLAAANCPECAARA